MFGPKAKDNEDIRGMLNAGHRRGATAGRCVLRGKTVETEELPAYCAVALAGLDDLPDTIMTRSVVVRMRRRAPDETVQPWRLRVNGPEGKKLHDRLAAWSQSCAEKLIGEFWPDMPTGVADRDADVWEALLAVADLAGGHWPTTARKAAVTLVTASRRRAPSIGVLLLRDIKKVFDEAGTDQLPTTRLVAALGALSESPWSSIRKGEPLDARGMAVRLSKYGIGSKAQRAGPEEVFKGYSRAQFTDAWNRYLVGLPDETDDDEPAPPVKGSASVTSVTETTGQVTVRQSVTGGATRSVTGLRDSIEPDLLSSGNGAVTDVTDESGQRGGRPRLCACDRPAPVDFDTGLCQWCTIAASKTGQR